MSLEEYLKKENLSKMEFAVLAGIGYTTVIRCVKGQKMGAGTAAIIDRATKGLVKIETLVKKKR